jgi:hypothetical protein
MRAMDAVPPRAPDMGSLQCVHGWLRSARTRGDHMVRTLLTDEEKLQHSVR